MRLFVVVKETLTLETEDCKTKILKRKPKQRQKQSQIQTSRESYSRPSMTERYSSPKYEKMFVLSNKKSSMTHYRFLLIKINNIFSLIQQFIKRLLNYLLMNILHCWH